MVVTVIPFTPLIQVLGGWYTLGLINMFCFLTQRIESWVYWGEMSQGKGQLPSDWVLDLWCQAVTPNDGCDGT